MTAVEGSCWRQSCFPLTKATHTHWSTLSITQIN